MTPHDLSGEPHVSETKQDWADAVADRVVEPFSAGDYINLVALRHAFAARLRDEREACCLAMLWHGVPSETVRAIRNREDKP